MEFYSSEFKTELGRVWLLADSDSLLAVIYDEYWEEFKKRIPQKPLEQKNKILLQTESELNEYFAGKRENFSVPVKFLWGTDFQKNVWENLLQIPYGKTWSYSELAEKLNNPQAVRAVGAANGQNPISIIVPCHRVIGKNSSLTGYAGGLAAKEYLLRLEKILLF